MRRLALVLAGNLVLSAVSPSLANAQPDRDVPTFKACTNAGRSADRAKKLFQVGKDSYDEGDYSRAVSYWLDAFESDCTANKLLLNLANAYERLGNVDGAIVSLETYLSRKPDDPDAPSIMRRIERLKEKRRNAAASAVAARPTPTPVQPPVIAAPSTTPAPEVMPAPVAPAPEDHGSKGPGPWPWVVAGTGAAAVATGVVVYLKGQSKVNEAATICAKPADTGEFICTAQGGTSGDKRKQEAQDASDAGTRLKTTGAVITGAGLAAIGGGVLWGVLGRHRAPTTSAWVTPEAAPGFAGIAAGGRF